MAKKKRKPQKQTENPLEKNTHPVGFYQLDEHDAEFWHMDKKGRKPRFFVEDVMGHRFYFVTERAARDFMTRHDMRPVADEVLAELRAKEAPESEL